MTYYVVSAEDLEMISRIRRTIDEQELKIYHSSNAAVDTLMAFTEWYLYLKEGYGVKPECKMPTDDRIKEAFLVLNQVGE